MVLHSMLVWPAVTLVGFLACMAVVIALGATSTARYEFARNAAQEPRPGVVPRTDNHPAGRRAATRPGADADGQGQAQSVAVAVRPAPAHQAATGPAWWLVDDAAQVVAGPFDDQVDAEWTALAGELAAIAVHGVRRTDATIAPRPSPADRAWLTELGDQLDRLPEDWDALISDTDPLTTLVVEVAAALVEAGLPLHDAAGGRPAGGVCLVPDVASGGVLVGWRTHDRMSVHGARGTTADAAVQQLMNDAVACTLAQLGFVVHTFGEVGCSLVTALR